MKPLRLSISIVVHNQATLAQSLLEDISDMGNKLSAEVLLTVNVDERLPFTRHDFHHPLTIIRNKRPKGFGANHNSAFKQSRGRYFCILNPDIRLAGENPFVSLIECLKKNHAGVVAPRIINPAGAIENSARRFPTPFSIIKKASGRLLTQDYPNSNEVYHPDWVGGMFMVFPRDSYSRIGGFDERYFLYYEDVDICARLKMKRLPVLLCPDAKAIHDGRAESHHNPRYMHWHLQSMLRFFLSRGFWKLAIKPRLGA